MLSPGARWIQRPGSLRQYRTPGSCRADVLIAIQKVLRFAVKYWDGLALSSGEMLLKGSTKALVFPFPYVANRSGYRIAIEREPNSKRLARRSEGRRLLVYKSGTSEGDGASEEASLTNFRRAYDDYEQFRATLEPGAFTSQSKAATEQIGITTLNGCDVVIPPEQGLERWLRLLTDEQRSFVGSGWNAPHRLEGPAGTGKTLCLVLKSIATLNDAKAANRSHRSVFIAPSDDLVETIRNRIVGNGGADYLCDIYEAESPRDQSILVITLQRLCAALLNYEVSESEFLDKDSVESKNTQLLYLDQIVSNLKGVELASLEGILSRDLLAFLGNEDPWTLAQLFRHEISVIIKGRANGSLDAYRAIPPLEYGLPIRTSADKQLVFAKYLDYQKRLAAANQYDIDDIVISATGQLDTPIWRRRRSQLGFDSILIDEVHLFNLNELSVLHYLTKNPAVVPITYSIDRSQAVGDIGWNDSAFFDAIGGGAEGANEVGERVKAVFRSSPEIVELAFCVTTSGAALFTNFQNPLDLASTTFTADDERKCAKPMVTYISDDGEYGDAAYAAIDGMSKSLQCSKDRILVVVFDEVLMAAVVASWRQANRAFRTLDRRGDYSAVSEAARGGFPLIGAPEHVGGLEFHGVIILGCEKGRVPPLSAVSDFGRAYLNYRAHNNLYVAITRAKYRVEFIANRNRGLSDVLRRANDRGLIADAAAT